MPFRGAYIVGVTGTVACGKSTCCKVMKEMGAVLIDADLLGHEAYLPGSPAFGALKEVFGASIVGENGLVNRQILGREVFQSPAKMKQLTDIVWPVILQLIQERIGEAIDKAAVSQEQNNLQPMIIVVEAAILLEAGWEALFDRVVLVGVEDPVEEKALLETRLQQRAPHLTLDEVRARLSSQKPFAERLKNLKQSAKTEFSTLSSNVELDVFRARAAEVYQELQRLALEKTQTADANPEIEDL